MTLDLSTAVRRRTEAQEHLTSLIQALTRARENVAALDAQVALLDSVEQQAIARHAQRLEVRALAGKGGEAPILVPADDIEHKRMAISRAAAAQAVQNLEGKVHTAQQNLTTALAALKKAAHAAMTAEVREAFNELQRLNERRLALRERLFGAYLLDCDTHAADPLLTDAEWQEVNAPGDEYSAERLNIGMPILGVSLTDGRAWGDPRLSRMRCNAACGEWRTRLSELESGGRPKTMTATEAA